jgi:hypothetical protein
VDVDTKEVYEIKPVLSSWIGKAQVAEYLALLNGRDPLPRWVPGWRYIPPKGFVVLDAIVVTWPPVDGVIIYAKTSLTELVALTIVAYRTNVMIATSTAVIHPAFAF